MTARIGLRARDLHAPSRDVAFRALVRAFGLPMPETEYRFAPPRRWRFDYAWVAERVALEVEGGAWTQGRHTRGPGFIRDMAKYNEAVVRGWALLRVTPRQLVTAETAMLVRRAMIARSGLPR